MWRFHVLEDKDISNMWTIYWTPDVDLNLKTFFDSDSDSDNDGLGLGTKFQNRGRVPGERT